MDKMKFESPDLTAQNIDRIAALFPNCITEMLDEEHSTPEKKVYKRAVNFELLKQMLSPDVVDGDEAYEFTWVGKKAAIVEANKPIRKTLRPCVAESKDWDTTENLYIEGDNLEVLKLLQESYLGKVKMIYIDPPYNTGSDRFIYPDDYGMTQDEYETASEVYDEEGNKVFSENLSSNPRYHSKWCSMIYQRLLLARGFLTEDGAIFISIDDKEQENLKKICDEVFGASNYVSTIVWQHSIQPKGYLGNFSIQHSYVLIYCKDALSFKLGSLERTDEDNKAYSNPDNDPKGPWRSGDVRNALYRPNLIYDIISPSGKVIKPCENGWRWSKETVAEKIKSGEIIFSADETRIIRKIYLSTLEGRAPETIWFGKDVGTTREGISELKQLFGQAPFDTPKPTRLIERCITLMNDPQMLIMDFFSGSATTAEAIMKANSKDGGHRTSIQIQYPEECGISSPARKMGYSTISEIGKERIRRAGDKIKSESPMTTQDLDIGFRVLKLDDTNMKDVYYAPDDYDQGMLAGLESNIKEDRTDLDLLFGCLIDWGLPLSLPYKSEQIDGCTVHTYNDGDLIACFDANIPENVVKEIAMRKPLRAVFRDSGFASSPEKINVFEIFKLYMPEDANDISKRVRVI
jgi:adenine-specific DNA-methyltransferase